MLSVSALLGCTRVGSELSSSLEEPPKVKTGFFFFCASCAHLPIESACSLDDSSVDEPRRAKTPDFLTADALGLWAAAISAVGMDDGALRSGTDRYDELTCAGEKPLTTLVVLLVDVPLTDSDDVGGAEVEEAVVVSSAVGVLSGCGDGRWGFGFSARGGREEMLRLRGFRSFFSLIVLTIFSRSSGVMCLSRPRLRLLAESCRWM
jgi:hypothetical protein